MKYLIVAAHPDDEVFGAGATICKLTQAGHKVDACILSGKAEARSYRPGDEELASDMRNSFDITGIREAFIEEFPNIKMNTVEHLQLVKAIESAILEAKPDVVITHHPADVNNDHFHTSLACQAAIRLFQRRPMASPIQELWYMEVPSSTDWCVNTAMNQFDPNLFVEIGEDGIAQKLKGIAAYGGVQRPFPHPSSEEAIRGLAAYRGAQSGCNYAEAFQVVFRRITF
ncbi:MAG: PIG-L family deacetylase [Clostridia bacterium]|nr:PIG-L family deacetylase [Clostridia bacterium]